MARLRAAMSVKRNWPTCGVLMDLIIDPDLCLHPGLCAVHLGPAELDRLDRDHRHHLWRDLFRRHRMKTKDNSICGLSRLPEHGDPWCFRAEAEFLIIPDRGGGADPYRIIKVHPPGPAPNAGVWSRFASDGGWVVFAVWAVLGRFPPRQLCALGLLLTSLWLTFAARQLTALTAAPFAKVPSDWVNRRARMFAKFRRSRWRPLSPHAGCLAAPDTHHAGDGADAKPRPDRRTGGAIDEVFTPMSSRGRIGPGWQRAARPLKSWEVAERRQKLYLPPCAPA